MIGSQDTIVAIASAPGRGGIGVVRLSGQEAHRIAERVFRSRRNVSGETPEPQKLIFGHVVDEGGEMIDEGYLVHFTQPRSYTGEDSVEFYGHGSPVVLDSIVSRCLKEGARLARGGEFTQRAFLNGKLDLVQAEAVAELIEANSSLEATAARRRLQGGLSSQMEKLRTLLVGLLAEIEAEIDFSDENLDLISETQKKEKIKQIQLLIRDSQASYDVSQRLSSGFRIVLVGRPNVGKSSLFNRLLESDRAIVTSVPGTTRDVLREEIQILGRSVRLIDTAGIREESQDPIEGVGVARSRQEAAEADLTLLILDAHEGTRPEDQQIEAALQGREFLRVWNKADLAEAGSPKGEATFVSAKTGSGLSELKQELAKRVTQAMPEESCGGVSNSRHIECLAKAQEAIQRAEKRISEQASSEFVAFELQEALRRVTEILGSKESSEAVLDEVFSRFCIGK